LIGVRRDIIDVAFDDDPVVADVCGDRDIIGSPFIG
jgi:hypothetical protein